MPPTVGPHVHPGRGTSRRKVTKRDAKIGRPNFRGERKVSEKTRKVKKRDVEKGGFGRGKAGA